MVPKPLPTVSMLVELYGEERGDSDPHETNPHPPPYRLRQVSVALAALALGAEEPLSTSLSSQARRLGGRGARAALGCVGGALTRLADAIPSPRSRGLGGSTGVLVSDASAGAAPATISTSHDGCAETLPTEETLPGEQGQSAIVTELPQSGERANGPAAAAASSSASSSDVRLSSMAGGAGGLAGGLAGNRARTWLGGSFEDAPQDESSDRRMSLSLGQAVSSGASL